tara:strand:+ start:612 stop:770 length:159 start_codon:yes stop_codon:yes gene_type:complete
MKSEYMMEKEQAEFLALGGSITRKQLLDQKEVEFHLKEIKNNCNRILRQLKG